MYLNHKKMSFLEAQIETKCAFLALDSVVPYSKLLFLNNRCISTWCFILTVSKKYNTGLQQ